MHSGELVEQALRLAVTQLWPVALAVGAAALLVGVAANRLGLVDPSVVLIARAAAVLAMLAAGGAAWFVETTAWTEGLWSQIGEIGRGAP